MHIIVERIETGRGGPLLPEDALLSNESLIVVVSLPVLCNKPEKYFVKEPEGVIASEKCTDVVLRHVKPKDVDPKQQDKFRINLFDAANTLLSKKDVLATLHPGNAFE